MGARWFEVAGIRSWRSLGAAFVSSAMAVLISCGTQDVVVEGDLEPEQRQMVTWSLRRFEAAGLQLPAKIKIGFDPSGSACEGSSGICRASASPPEVVVCEPEGDTEYRIMTREITLLHELAHVWHWAQGDGEDWIDYSTVVGGRNNSPDVAWKNLTHERVAIVISWGLFDHLRRPVRSDVKCVDLYTQFEQLTQHRPLEPLNDSCVPDPITDRN